MKNESRGHCAAFRQPGIETAELTSRGNSEEEEVSAFGACLRRPLPTGVTQPSGAAERATTSAPPQHAPTGCPCVLEAVDRDLTDPLKETY